jgi:hypothetical protein
MIGGMKMVKLEALEEFTLGRFEELTNIVRVKQEVKGRLFVGDVFECTEDLANYLTGDNHLKRAVAKVIGVIPEEKEEVVEEKVEEKPKTEVKTKTTKKSKKSKK